MKRKIYTQLVDWKNQKHHKPLILNGVRQCGKTYILKKHRSSKAANQPFVDNTLLDRLSFIYFKREFS